jgi:hypothetical protein
MKLYRPLARHLAQAQNRINVVPGPVPSKPPGVNYCGARAAVAVARVIALQCSKGTGARLDGIARIPDRTRAEARFFVLTQSRAPGRCIRSRSATAPSSHAYGAGSSPRSAVGASPTAPVSETHRAQRRSKATICLATHPRIPRRGMNLRFETPQAFLPWVPLCVPLNRDYAGRAHAGLSFGSG